MAPKILKFFLVVFDIYTQPWTKLQNEIQKFCFFRTGYWIGSKIAITRSIFEILSNFFFQIQIFHRLLRFVKWV